jgi:hypothetical protein
MCKTSKVYLEFLTRDNKKLSNLLLWLNSSAFTSTHTGIQKLLVSCELIFQG